jgi:hypothetical protein
MATAIPRLIHARSLLSECQRVAVADGFAPQLQRAQDSQERSMHYADIVLEPALKRLSIGCDGAEWDNRRPRQEA